MGSTSKVTVLARGGCEASSQWGGVGLAQFAGRLDLGVGPVDEDSTWSGGTG